MKLKEGENIAWGSAQTDLSFCFLYKHRRTSFASREPILSFSKLRGKYIHWAHNVETTSIQHYFNVVCPLCTLSEEAFLSKL